MKCSPFVFKILLTCGTWLCCLSALGQSPSDLALKNIQKQKWQRAHYLLTKAVAKDSLNVTAKYVLAQYFFSDYNPAHDLDSAYHQVLLALHDFQRTSSKQRERLKRFPVDSLLLVNLREGIDSMAFERSRASATKDALDHFIRNFSTSSRRDMAVTIRDSIAYNEATQTNTLEAFRNFLQDYPEARQEKLARNAYNKLLFDERTGDQKLESFESFIKDHPESSFRSLAEKFIFEYRTASGNTEAFLSFIQLYPKSPFVEKAKNILFHLLPESDRDLLFIKDELSSDSIATVIQSENFYLVPFLKNGKFGFINSQGTEIIPAVYDSLEERYLCGNVTDDFIVLPDKIVSKNGAIIWEKNPTEVEDIGCGFLLIKGENCLRLIHKSGFAVASECIDDAKIVGQKFVAVLQQGHWSIMTFTGRLLAGRFDEVSWLKNILVAKTEGKYKLIVPDSIAKLPRGSSNALQYEFDETKAWGDGLVFVRKNDAVGLLNQRLEFVVPLGNHVLTPAPSAIIVSSREGKILSTIDGRYSKMRFENIVAHNNWTAVKSKGRWRFYDMEMDTTVGFSYDTLMFAGPFAIAQGADSVTIYFSKTKTKQWYRYATVDVIPSRDSLAFLAITLTDKKNVYSERGEKLFAVAADKIQYLGSGLFLIQKNEKKGLMSSAGKLLLPIEYDAIATSDADHLSLLKLRKFGLYDVRKGRLIKPLYDKNIISYNEEHSVAFKDGYYGFVNWKNKTSGNFEFSEVQFWNDTSALVKKKSTWMIVEIKSAKILVDKIKDFRFIRDSPIQGLAIFHQDDGYGVYDNLNGVIIPATFSYILNVGSRDEPLYFTEKHVEEAFLFVVIYYDKMGAIMRKETYDHDDYDKIYCDRN